MKMFLLTALILVVCGCTSIDRGDEPTPSKNPVYPEFTPWWVDNTMNTNSNAKIVYPE